MSTDRPARPVVGGRRRDDASVWVHPASQEPNATQPAGPVPAPLAELLAADGAHARHRVVAGLLREVDHDWLVYGRLELTGDRRRPVALWTAHADAGWARRYCAQAYHEVDPRLEEAAASSLPCTWTLDNLHEHANHPVSRPALRRFVADLGDTGMRSGALLMLPGDGERRRDFMSLLSRAPGPRAMGGALLGRVLTLGLCLHEYYTRYSVLPTVPGRATVLSPLQLEILRHVGRGESDKRIAHHLRISSHAVDYHMRQLRRRFGVHNRVQLAQVSRGLVG